MLTLADLLFNQIMRRKQVGLCTGFAHRFVSTVKECRGGENQNA
jgi:hypothetical protein